MSCLSNGTSYEFTGNSIGGNAPGAAIFESLNKQDGGSRKRSSRRSARRSAGRSARRSARRSAKRSARRSAKRCCVANNCNCLDKRTSRRTSKSRRERVASKRTS